MEIEPHERRHYRGRTSKRRKTGTDWEALNRLSAADIRAGIDSDPDARATDENFWRDAQVIFPQPKRLVTLRLDADLLEWFRRESGYQTRINAILRAYMDAKNPRAWIVEHVEDALTVSATRRRVALFPSFMKKRIIVFSFS
ncbi:MAG: BrnA antitoxin family protein [Chromatiales bacterium]|nr:BrnA antitoxin family protein [Chromatiales bacterium]